MDNHIDDITALSSVKGFKIVHLNVRSLPKKIDQLRTMLFGSQLDVVTLSETWLNAAVNSATVSIDGFTAYRLDRTSKVKANKRGGGLITYVCDKYAADCEELLDLNRTSPDIEAQWSIIHRPHCKDMVLCNVYRPPSGKLDRALTYLNECIKTLDLCKMELYILGDLNVNYKNQSSCEYKKVKFFGQANGLAQLITTTTRNTDKTKSLLDLVLTNSKYISVSGTLNHYISDHQPIFVVKKKGRDTRPSVDFQGRSYRNFDKTVFRDKLVGRDWDNFYDISDPVEAWDSILGNLTPVLDEMCPIRTFRIKNYRPNWISDELIEQIKDRDYFYKRAKLDNEEDSWNIARHLRNVTNANIRHAKKDFVIDNLNNCHADCKKFWHAIRSVIPSNKGSTRQDILLKKNGKKVGKKEVAHHINDFFINIGKIPSSNTRSNKGYTRPPVVEQSDGADTDWCLENFTVDEVLKVVRDINVSKSSGLDSISSFIIKEAFGILLPQITYMMNLSVKTSIFPKAWKKALVIPIPKSGNLTQVQNYRPISLLPLPGKILEKLVHKQLENYIETNSLLVDTQHGFRKKHSTIHSVEQLTNYIEKKMNRGMTTLATFVDFRKAFDCVQHPVLLKKLSSLGINNSTIRWFTSYLTDRKQRVLANNVYSSYQTVTQGVPQGSVLGPLFYILYANDISDTIINCKVAMYADDTVLYTADSNFEDSMRKMRSDVQALSSWCGENGIRMNTDKTKTMSFGSAKKLKKLPPLCINIDDAPLQTVSCYKYLGVTLDGQLNFAKHVSKIISNVSLKLKQLRRMRPFLTTKAAIMVYKNMLLPMIEYGDVFVTGANLENKRKLQVLQNKGLRCALGRDREAHVDDLHEEANLWRLKFRRDLHLYNLMFDRSKIENNLRKV